MRVPDDVASQIIGRGGETVRRIQSESGAVVRMSCRGEYYPGTQDRIITLSGAPEQVVAAKNMIQNVISTPDPVARDQLVGTKHRGL